MVLVDVSRARILHSDAYTPGGERGNNVVRTCALGRRACRVQREEGRDAELSTNLRGNGRNPETHGVLRIALCHRYANWAQLA